MNENLKESDYPNSRALVVEGGGMRGVFASGVLDRFLEQDHEPFDFCIGVSAGATNLAGWLTRQHGRSYRITTDYSCRKNFFSLTNYFKGGHAMDLDWLWDITIKEDRLDLKMFSRRSSHFYIVVTNVNTGYAAYMKATEHNLEVLLKASCAIPLVYRGYPEVGGECFTDGGVADSIPVIHAYEIGARDITVVLSRPPGYRKQKPKYHWLLRRLLHKTPQLAEAMIRRHQQYNRSLDFLLSPPSDCIVRIIAPDHGMAVSRATTNPQKLASAYQMGREKADMHVESCRIAV